MHVAGLLEFVTAAGLFEAYYCHYLLPLGSLDLQAAVAVVGPCLDHKMVLELTGGKSFDQTDVKAVAVAMVAAAVVVGVPDVN